MIKLSELSADAPSTVNRDEIKKETKRLQEGIAILQERLYAEKKQSLLIVLQGMDSAGKDGTTEKVFRRCTPVGVSTKSYKKPTEEEFAHDFLWRVHKETPGHGEIKVFIRSHYEDVLIQKVHNWIDEERVQLRYKAINIFEELIQKDANTTVLKIFLHLSKERQEEKLKERMQQSQKFWKHNDNDWKEREHWDDYWHAYEAVFENCNQPAWNVVPANQRWYRNYLACKLVYETLEKMAPQYPPLKTEML